MKYGSKVRIFQTCKHNFLLQNRQNRKTHWTISNRKSYYTDYNAIFIPTAPKKVFSIHQTRKFPLHKKPFFQTNENCQALKFITSLLPLSAKNKFESFKLKRKLWIQQNNEFIKKFEIIKKVCLNWLTRETKTL
jgi:hypothetical protein